MRLPYANMKMHHWNTGAEMPLILPVHLICNTSDEQIESNIRTNSRNGRSWVKVVDAHEKVAILCGSGPSLADMLDEIREKQDNGGVVFAMNGAAQYLSDNGIMPDYQCIIDAREQTADLLGPAKQHLFASQVHPKCFHEVPDALLWHLEIGVIDTLLPEYHDDYCLIGGAASVGNTATCLAYALGFRNLQIYGYDSSHRDNDGHAFDQPMNNGEPCCVVAFSGKEYTASLTMKLQAEKFQETAQALIDEGCHIEVHGDGLLPDIFNSPPMPEVDKYRQLWAMPAYRDLAPGEMAVAHFVEIATAGSTVIDLGCGTGRAGKALSDAGFKVTLVDFTENSRDEGINLPFVQADLTEPLPVSADYGFCTDVMEHIPPNDIDTVIGNIMAVCGESFFQICLIPDNFGEVIGQKLHLSVFPYDWWLNKFKSLGFEVKWSSHNEVEAEFHIT